MQTLPISPRRLMISEKNVPCLVEGLERAPLRKPHRLAEPNVVVRVQPGIPCLGFGAFQMQDDRSNDL